MRLIPSDQMVLDRFWYTCWRSWRNNYIFGPPALRFRRPVLVHKPWFLKNCLYIGRNVHLCDMLMVVILNHHRPAIDMLINLHQFDKTFLYRKYSVSEGELCSFAPNCSAPKAGCWGFYAYFTNFRAFILDYYQIQIVINILSCKKTIFF